MCVWPRTGTAEQNKFELQLYKDRQNSNVLISFGSESTKKEFYVFLNSLSYDPTLTNFYGVTDHDEKKI